MKIYEADDYRSRKGCEIWFFKRDNPTSPEQEGEMPEAGETIQIVSEKTGTSVVMVDKVELIGGKGYWPQFLVTRFT